MLDNLYQVDIIRYYKNFLNDTFLTSQISFRYVTNETKCRSLEKQLKLCRLLWLSIISFTFCRLLHKN